MAYYEDEYNSGGDTGGYKTGYESMQQDYSNWYSGNNQNQQADQEFDWEGYFQILEENVYGATGDSSGASQAAQSSGGGGGYSITNQDYDYGADIYARHFAEDQSYGGGYHGGTGGGSSGPTQQLDLSGIDLDLPDYELPEEDESIYKKEYEMVYQRSKAPVAQGVSEAIMSSKSLDNPMARMDFVRKALSGYGQALTAISQAATEAAQEKAAYEYNKLVQEYNMQYKKEYAEAVAAYEKEIQQAVANWESGQDGDDGYGDAWWNKDPWESAGMSEEEYNERYRK